MVNDIVHFTLKSYITYYTGLKVVCNYSVQSDSNLTARNFLLEHLFG